MATTEEDALGSGIALSDDLDFMLQDNGDLLSASGIEELEKDLSVNMIFQLTFGGPDGSGYLGTPLTPETESDILDLIRRTALSDERINTVKSIFVRSSPGQRNTLEIELDVVTSIDERSLVITVGE